MIWQDFALTAVSIVFMISLVPQVYLGFKKKIGTITRTTSIPTFLGLFFISGVYITLELYLSAIIGFFVGLLWFALFIQRIIYKK
jgi:hypothetical protein